MLCKLQIAVAGRCLSASKRSILSVLHVGERGGRIQTIFFPSLNIEYSLVYDAFPALSLFDRDFHTEKKNRNEEKQTSYKAPSWFRYEIAKPDKFRAAVFRTSKLTSGIICAGSPIPLVLNYVCNLFGATIVFCYVSVVCLIWWDAVLFSVSVVMEVNTNFWVALGTKNNYFQFPFLL